jgi:GntR family transcriptional regulator, transcriptional repressor for pyruvate dehydrogenase complex
MTGQLEVSPPSRLVLFQPVASQLEELILTGKVDVGSRLPPEGTLATQFGVSRPVIREALAQLRDRGLVETVNGAGTYVRRPDAEHLAEVLLRHLRFESMADQQVVIESLYEARTAVEVTAARLAAARGHEAEVQLLGQRLDEMRKAAGDPMAWIAADMGFHIAVVDASHNMVLGAFLSPLTRIIQQSMSESWRSREAVRSGLAAHKKIWVAIAAGDEDAAARAMQDHLLDSKARLSSVLVMPRQPRRGQPPQGRHQQVRQQQVRQPQAPQPEDRQARA